MEFSLIKNRLKLEGTAYFEFLPGKFDNKHWNDDSVFLSEDSMAIIEDLFEKNISSYDHFSFCEVQREELERLISDLEIRQSNLIDGSVDVINGTVFSDDYYQELTTRISEYRNDIISMIKDLSNWIQIILLKQNTISILGI